ncbi:MAG: four helix bundle protein [Bacteroidota bacterium]|nr:four helix bundle protein [Bacteroidota bacterium]
MATINRIEELEIWQLARRFAKDLNVVLETDSFKVEFGLKQQMKNASGSIMDNIAEGFGRGSKHEFVNHLTIAKGSAEESRSQLFRCLDLSLMDEVTLISLFDQLEILVRKIAALIQYLNNVTIKGQKFKDRI